MPLITLFSTLLRLRVNIDASPLLMIAAAYA